MTPRSRWLPIVVAAGAAMVLALLGRLATDLGPWYMNLRQSPLKPPDWAFGPAWTTIYTLGATAGVLAWRGASTHHARSTLLAAFAFNAAVNVLWSVLFFKLRRPDWSLMEVGVLWLSIAMLIVVVRRTSKLGGWLLLPYLLWVSFASYVNYAVVQLNGPFGGS